jgi:hypothetical protein
MPKPTPNPQPVTARLTTPAQMVASLPLWLGYVPTDSLVVACCHEPRGRIGLTLRFDLPPAALEQALVEEVTARVVHQQPTRLLIAVYSDEADDRQRARTALVEELCDRLALELPGLRITEAVLVREGRFWSYLCGDVRCCPTEGTPVSAARTDPEVALLEAEQVLRGQVVQRDRDALARSLEAPQLLAAAQGRQECEEARSRHLAGRARDVLQWRERWLSTWADWVVELEDPGDTCLEVWDAAELATSLEDVLLRDALIAESEPDQLLPLLREVLRRTPAPFDAPVCTVFAWLTYCEGGGAEVTIALERALRTDPGYGLATLLGEVMLGQVPPAEVRRLSRRGAGTARSATAARRRGRR